jgi:hypothetical protein
VAVIPNPEKLKKKPQQKGINYLQKKQKGINKIRPSYHMLARAARS